MIILGLGSNVGNKINYLRLALQAISAIKTIKVKQVSPLYLSDALLPDHAPTSWDNPYLNCALRCESELSPHTFLAKMKQIESNLGHSNEHWGPRNIDIDILAWDNWVHHDEKLQVPHEELHKRPFALWPLADVAPFWTYPLKGPLFGKTASELTEKWGSRFDGKAPLHTRQIAQRIDTPALVGIVNLTPDSFSDGGQCFEAPKALKWIQTQIKAGAEVIDVGAEATGPNTYPLDPELEWTRLCPLLTELMDIRKDFPMPPKISVDTRNAQTALKALELGVDWINDVSGLDDLAMRDIIASQKCDVVFMHHCGIPAGSQPPIPSSENVTEVIERWLEKRLALLEKHGIAKQRLIFDVGIGYGKTPSQSLALIKNIHLFKRSGLRLLIGHSRKSFLSHFTSRPPEERDLETTILSLYLAGQGVDYLRVHNVDQNARAFKMVRASFLD